jgi:hypothetical protein
MSVTTKATTTATKARGKKKSSFDELATCPVNGAGWCPYPFSMAQLKRRLKAKAAAEAAAQKAISSTKSVDKRVKQPAAKASS